MPVLEEPPATTADDLQSAVLGIAATSLVDHLARSMHQLRLVLRLLEQDPASLEARRVLGEEFEHAGDALGVAQSFRNSIRQLEEVGPITASALLSDEVVTENLATWVRSIDHAHRLVIADLTGIAALATPFTASDGPETASDHAVVLELIALLSRNAVERLDIAHPPAVD